MNKNKLIQQVIDGFRHNKGKASMYCFTKEIIPKIISSILYNYINNRPDDNIFIIVDCYNTRQNILKEIKQNNINTEHIKILSKDFIKAEYNYNYNLIITVGINDDFKILNHLHNSSKFTLSIITENIMNFEFINNVRNILPMIETIDFSVVVNSDRIYSPVEEHRYGVDISDSDRENYDKCTLIMNNALSIFGNLDNINYCRTGDTKNNISAIEICNNIAKENGWREDLDINNPFMKQIDDVYNPNVLYETANTFYNISKQRRDLLTDNEAKLSVIYDICNKYKDKKILIVSKRGEFASKVTNYINKRSSEEDNEKGNNLLCADYHDFLENSIGYDEDGHIIVYKSGSILGSL